MVAQWFLRGGDDARSRQGQLGFGKRDFPCRATIAPLKCDLDLALSRKLCLTVAFYLNNIA